MFPAALGFLGNFFLEGVVGGGKTMTDTQTHNLAAKKARLFIQDTLCTQPAAAPASQGGDWATGAPTR